MELINRKAAKGYAESIIADPILLMAVNAVLDNAPGVMEQKPGRWIITPLEWNLFKCSECGKTTNDISRFCPDCGALMGGHDGKA